MKRLLKYMVILPAFVLGSCSDYDIKGWQMTPDELTDTSLLKFIVETTHEGRSYQYAGIIDGDEVVVRVPYKFDRSILEKATTVVDLPNMALISPSPFEESDYSRERTVKVTAADKQTTKVYTYRLEPYGFGNAYEFWFKSWEDLGLQTFDDQGNETSFDVNTNSAAVCGDYLVTSRTHMVLDRLTGEVMDFQLNTTGVPNQVFWLTNDDVGNMIGCTLAQITDGSYNIYKWTDPRSAPVLVWESKVDAGRRIDVRGDINATAYITSWLRDTNQPVMFHRIKVEDGVVTELPEINSGRRRLTTDTNWPSCTLKEPADTTVYYVFTNYSADWDHWPCLTFGETTEVARNFVIGPMDSSIGYSGWGNQYRHYAGVYVINDVSYLTIMNGFNTGGDGHFLVVAEVDEIKNWWGILSASSYYVPEFMKLSYNPNRTVSISVVNDGEDAYLFALATGTGISCHRLETSWEED